MLCSNHTLHGPAFDPLPSLRTAALSLTSRLPVRGTVRRSCPPVRPRRAHRQAERSRQYCSIVGGDEAAAGRVEPQRLVGMGRPSSRGHLLLPARGASESGGRGSSSGRSGACAARPIAIDPGLWIKPGQLAHEQMVHGAGCDYVFAAVPGASSAAFACLSAALQKVREQAAVASRITVMRVLTFSPALLK